MIIRIEKSQMILQTCFKVVKNRITLVQLSFFSGTHLMAILQIEIMIFSGETPSENTSNHKMGHDSQADIPTSHVYELMEGGNFNLRITPHFKVIFQEKSYGNEVP